MIGWNMKQYNSIKKSIHRKQDEKGVGPWREVRDRVLQNGEHGNKREWQFIELHCDADPLTKNCLSLGSLFLNFFLGALCYLQYFCWMFSFHQSFHYFGFISSHCFLGFQRNLYPALWILTWVIFFYKVLLLRHAIHRWDLCGETAASFRVSSQQWFLESIGGGDGIFNMQAFDRLFFWFRRIILFFQGL